MFMSAAIGPTTTNIHGVHVAWRVRCRCYLDQKDIESGVDWEVSFRTGLHRSCLFVPLVSVAGHKPIEDVSMFDDRCVAFCLCALTGGCVDNGGGGRGRVSGFPCVEAPVAGVYRRVSGLFTVICRASARIGPCVKCVCAYVGERLYQRHTGVR